MKYIYYREGDNRKKPWRVCVYTNKGSIELGYYATFEEAVKVRNNFKDNNPKLFVGVKKRIRKKKRNYEIKGLHQSTKVESEGPIVPKTGFIIGSPSSTTGTAVVPDVDPGIYKCNEVPRRIMIISDTHAPYHHVDTLAFITKVYDDLEPDLVVILGDEIDSNSISFYPSNPSLPNASTELKLARDFIRDLNSIIGLGPVIAVESNHTSRIYKKAKSAGIPKELILPYHQLLGVNWMYSKDWLVPCVNGTDILFSHTKGLNTRAAGQMGGTNICVGHFHKRGGVEWWKTQRGQEFFSMSVPCLINHNSPAYGYDENSANRQNLGVGIIEEGIPYVIPMFTDKDERWTGELWRQLKS